jgi:V8-like Glu-specific endopeptidase
LQSETHFLLYTFYYMRHCHILLLALLLLALAGCKKDPQEIFNEEKSGVVLICNEFYYDVALADGEHLYFTGIDDDGSLQGLTSDLNEIKKNPSVLNGTGFFIDNTGRILTNRHVVAPEINKEMVRKNMNNIIEGYAQYIQLLQDSMNARYQAIQEYAQSQLYEDEYGDTQLNMTQDEYDQLNEEVESLKQQYAQAENVKESVRSNILGYNFSIQLHSQFGIAYDGSNVRSWDDFMKNGCTLLKVSPDSNSDLALLQLNSKTTPTDKYIFDYTQYDADQADLKITDPLYMIGYNQGINLAQTDNGIRVQFTTGTVSQTPDGTRVVYSIPSMQGSSGSPVIDAQGRLVAVNFAGSRGSDNFNFGIPLLRVITFLK